MAYVTSDDGDIVMLADVTRARYDEKRSKVTIVTKDDRRVIVSAHAYEAAQDVWYQSVTPAAPGTYILEASMGLDDKFEGWTRAVVLVWGLDHRGMITPITREGILDYRVIMHPGGIVETTTAACDYTLRQITKMHYPDFVADTDAQLWAPSYIDE